jgi:AmmeMemoRadiSam system protein B
VLAVKQSELAGTWYPGSEERLRREVDRCLQLGKTAAAAVPVAAIVVPHAGYAYSAEAAGAGYASLESDCRRAVVVAPSHFFPFRGAAVPDFEGFATPLGRVGVDTAGVAALAEAEEVTENREVFFGEHALEIQLPFLQRVMPQADVVPVLVGEVAAAEDLDGLGAALRRLEDARTVFVISSDFVHYGTRFGYLPFPASGAEAVRAGLRELDMGAIDRVCAGDPTAFTDYLTRTGATVCGRAPITVFLAEHAQRTRGQLLRYYTSLDKTGDFEHSVSYASIAFPR